MAQNSSIPIPAALSAEQLTNFQNGKIVEEFRKTHVEIAKLEAELTQMTRPFRTVPFYFTCITTVLSGIAAVAAVYGLTMQSSTFRMEVADLKRSKELTEGRLADLKLKTKAQEDAAELAKTAATEAKLQLIIAASAKEEADRSLLFAAQHTLRTYESLLGVAANADAARFDPDKIQAAREHLAEFLDQLGQKEHDYRAVVATLDYRSPDIRRFGALILSRLSKDNVAKSADRTAAAEKILAALLVEKKIETRRLEVTAIGRLGRHAVPPLLHQLKHTDGEARLNVIRALGELGAEATDAAIGELIGMLDESDKQVKRQAVLALGAIGPTAARAEDAIVAQLPSSKLEGLLGDAEASGLMQAIIVSLRKIGATRLETFTRLLPLFDIDDPRDARRPLNELRTKLFRTFGAIDRKAAPAAAQPLAVAVKKIQAIIEKEHDIPLLEEAAIALARIGSGKEIEALAQSKDRDHVQAALIGLTALAPEEARRASLATLIDKKGENFLAPSVIFLLKGRGVQALPLLLDALALVKKNGYIRENLINAIGDLGKQSISAAESLTGVLHDPNPYVQLAAIRNLERIGLATDPRAQEAVERLVGEPKITDMVRRAARGAVFAAVRPEKTIADRLTVKSAKYQEKYYDPYSYPFEKGFVYQIDMQSQELDSFLYLKKGETTIAFDDDSGGKLNARLFFEPPETGSYVIWATTYARGAVGSYTLEIRKLNKKE